MNDREVDGIVLLDKPEGLSSNAALQRVRRAYQARKAGHTGSLDPLASGLLPICLGQATKASGLLLDAMAAYDFVAARYPAGRIVLWGESLGTGVAVALAAERPIGGLILDAPFSSAADIGAAAYPFIPVRWFIKDSFRSDERIGRVKAPLLVLHGEMDQIIPVRFGERLFTLANEPKQMVRFPSGGHVNLDDHGAPDAVRAFLNGLTRTLN